MVQVNGLDALKQPWVQPHVVGVFRQNGLNLLCQGVHLVVGLCRQQVEEYGRDAPEQVVVAVLVVLLINNSIVESGPLRVVERFLYQLVVASDAFHEGFFVVFQSDAVKGHRVVRRVVGFQKRILMFFVAHCFLFFIWDAKILKNDESYLRLKRINVILW